MMDPPNKKISPVRTAMVRFPTNPLCLRTVSYANINMAQRMTKGTVSKEIKNESMTATARPAIPHICAVLRDISPHGIGRSGWAVISIS